MGTSGSVWCPAVRNSRIVTIFRSEGTREDCSSWNPIGESGGWGIALRKAMAVKGYSLWGPLGQGARGINTLTNCMFLPLYLLQSSSGAKPSQKSEVLMIKGPTNVAHAEQRSGGKGWTLGLEGQVESLPHRHFYSLFCVLLCCVKKVVLISHLFLEHESPAFNL